MGHLNTIFGFGPSTGFKIPVLVKGPRVQEAPVQIKAVKVNMDVQ